MKFTTPAIAALEYSGSKHEQVIWDDELPGFGLKLWPSGRKVFFVAYRFKGLRRNITIGAFGVLTPFQAKDLAKQALGKLALGIDPMADRDEERTAARMSDLCEKFLNDDQVKAKKSYRQMKRRVEKNIEPVLGTKLLKGITRADITALHATIGKRGHYEANRTVSLLSKMFELAKAWGYLPETALNPAKRIEKYEETARDRFISHEEMPRLLEATEKVNNPYIRSAIWLYLLLGLRKQELLRLRWDQIDLTRRELRLPDTKSGKPHVLPISEGALKVLRETPKMIGNPHVFPGCVPGHHIVNIEKSWKTIRELAKLEDIRLHDLRRTVGSWMAESGSTLNLIGKVLNHQHIATTQIYARMGQAPVLEALERHSEALMSASVQLPRK